MHEIYFQTKKTNTMKKKIIVFALLCSAITSQAASTFSFEPTKLKVAFLPRETNVKPECSFSASLAINIVGQTASITCSSSQSTCDAAINDVARCIKLARNRLQSAFGF